MKIIKIALLAGALSLACSTVYAFNPDAGDAAKGKEVFRVKCRSCHDGGKAKKLSPSYKTKKQWERYFKNDFKKLKRKMPDFDSFGLTVEQLQDIYRHLVDHALDSDRPQTCD